MKLRGEAVALGILACTAAGHELTTMSPTIGALHREFHRVSASYPLADQMTLRKSHEEGSWSLLWFFDPTEDHLYRCSVIGEDVLCSPKGEPYKIAWRLSELQYGEREGLVPADRRSAPTVYMLDSETPFAQTTTWVWYTGRGRVVRCRTTLTEYKFEAPTSQGTLFIDSEQAPKVKRECSQVFPK